MKPRTVITAVVLLAFTAYSLIVVFQHGYFGFATLAWHQPWAMQMLIDLSIALFLVSRWLKRDAQTRGINALPYLIALPFLGSISPLIYMVHRELKR